MKKVLFVIGNMKIGGTRSSLINLLRLLPYDKIDVHLLILSPHGEYMGMIDERVKVINTTKVCESIYSPFLELATNKKLNKIIFALQHKLFGDRYIVEMAVKSFGDFFNQENYKAIIGFQEGDSLDFSSIVPGNKHFCWIHNDCSDLKSNVAGLERSFDVMDKIFFVSKVAMENYKNFYPAYNAKLKVIRNTLDLTKIVEKSEIPINDKDYLENIDVRIVSVGRLTNQKRFDRIIDSANELLLEKINFRWFIIGDGDRRGFLETQIVNAKLNDNVFLLGARANPYPYIKKADILVVTSESESQPMVVLEALTLGVPVLSTDFSSAREILKGKKYAEICENSAEGIKNGIKEILSKEKLLYMKMEAKKFSYDNKSIIDKILEEIKS